MTDKTRGIIGILTGGGEVPGLNPAIRAITIRAIREGYRVLGIKRGWGGLIDLVRDKDADNSEFYIELSEPMVNKAARTGGSFLHNSRIRPDLIPLNLIPAHLRNTYTAETNDLTPEILLNLAFLKIDYLIPVGGNDTLAFALRLYREGVKIVAIPKTMDNDVPGTDYCIGFSTCVTRTVELINNLRASAESHERILTVEVFGKQAGFTALLPTLAGVASRCVIPEHKFDIELLTQLLIKDRNSNPGKYAIVIASEGATIEGTESVINSELHDHFAYPQTVGIGDIIAQKIKEISPKYNHGKTINTITQRLGYLVRGGNPDSIDSIIPMVFGNLAFDLIKMGIHGRMVVVKNGRYDNIPLDILYQTSKRVNVEKYYDTERYYPYYKFFEMKPLFIMTSE